MATFDALTEAVTRTVPATEKVDPAQVKNNAGGYVFTVDEDARLNRFLILGVEGGTYYVKARDLAIENVKIVRELAEKNPIKLVNAAVDVSVSGRAAKQEPALFALAAAAASSDVEGRRAALAALPQVARTATALYTFMGYSKAMRGVGSTAFKRAIEKWLTEDTNKTAYQITKYRNRNDWTPRRIIQLDHPKPKDEQQRRLFRWALGYDPNWSGDGIRIVEGFQKARAAKPSEVAQIVREYRLVREMVPTDALKRPDVWEALLESGMPQTALLRNLPTLTNVGLVAQVGAEWTQRVCDQLTDPERLKKARVHPLSILNAMRVYERGHGEKGSNRWTPVQRIVDALDAAFYASFDTVESTGKTHMLAIDVSGSMTWDNIAKMSITPRDAATVMALVTAKVEPEHVITAFSSGLAGHTWTPSTKSSRRSYYSDWGIAPLGISPHQRLTDAISVVGRTRAGGTDCALPMRWALETKTKIDVFTIYTDSENWAGDVHPHKALEMYRNKINPNARLIVVGMTATDWTIADPKDPGSLNVAGFDTATPQLMADFALGRI
jgi:60 kDa SS-A/Ro ribonucleoprotein